MKKLLFAAAVVSCMSTAFAQTSSSDAKTTASGSETTGVVVIGNKLCPVSGHAVGSMEKDSKVVFKGQVVGLCCMSCEKQFMTDPEKFAMKAKEEAKGSDASKKKSESKSQ
jgi:hypothetical protein